MGIFVSKYRYWLILLLAGYSYLNAGFSKVQVYYPIPGNSFELAGYFATLSLLVWEGDRFIGAWLSSGRSWHAGKEPWKKDLLIFFGITTLYSLTVSAGLSFLLSSYAFGLKGEKLSVVVRLSATLGTRINLFLQVVNAIYIFLFRLKEKEDEANELRRANEQAEVLAIRSQVNPHFLFNNLNVLSSLVLQERPEATRFIEAFTKVYRQVLNVQQKEAVPLMEELSLLDDYLFLLRQRFPDSIYVSVEVQEMHREWLIVPLALQMLIENAVKHNTATREDPLRIQVATTVGHQLMVVNNLQPRPVMEASSRIGLLNIDQRYVLLSGQHIVIDRTDKKFSVKVPLISPFA